MPRLDDLKEVLFDVEMRPLFARVGKVRLGETPLIDPMDGYNGLARRMQAIAIAGDDAAVGADARAAALATISNFSVAELQNLANAHILFADHARRRS